MAEILQILTTLETQQSRQELAQLVEALRHNQRLLQSQVAAQSHANGLYQLVFVVLSFIMAAAIVGLIFDVYSTKKKVRNLEKRLDAVLAIRQDQNAA